MLYTVLFHRLRQTRSFNSVIKGICFALLLAPLWLNAQQTSPTAEIGLYQWQKSTTEPYRGKQDDICFVNERKGWYVNGGGNIYHTTDGGTTWANQINKPGTFFRCIGMVDSLVGVAGNIGTDYFPNVSDTIPLYRTVDGGKSWTPIDKSAIKGPYPKGLCAIEVLKVPYVNHGKLDYKTTIYAGGRVGTPAFLLKSTDQGATWTSQDMNGLTSMILDVKFLNAKEGFICGASSGDVAASNAVILRTEDGGKSWKKVYQSTRPYELTWKGSFPTDKVGYVSIQSYNPDTTVKQQYIVKTVDGGKTWTELPLVNRQCREFGIGFVDADRGWVGTLCGGYQTLDGGKTFTKVPIGNACNKIRFIKLADGSSFGAAIGVEVRTLRIPK